MKMFSTYFLVWATGTCLFLIQFVVIWVEFFRGETGIGNSQIDSAAKKQLPCLTFCPLPAFKSIKFPALTLETSLESYLSLTYGREDIFPSKSKELFTTYKVITTKLY